MNQQLDIVVGDFGRPGTLRYLRAFSERERELIAARLGPDRPFFDEHRRVQLTVLCQLGYIKQRILAPYFRDGLPLDEGVMVGTSSGAPVSEIVPELAVLLAEHVRVAHGQGARRIRVVFPCNTLGLLAEPLEQALDQHLSEDEPVAIAPMQPVVAKVLRERGLRSVRVLGTPGSVSAYRQALQRSDPAIAVLDNPDELVRAYEQCIADAIRGDPPDDVALGTVISHLGNRREIPTVVLEACTDVCLGLGHDALEIYANQLAHEAY